MNELIMDALIVGAAMGAIALVAITSAEAGVLACCLCRT
jgi:hypothetical protein